MKHASCLLPVLWAALAWGLPAAAQEASEPPVSSSEEDAAETTASGEDDASTEGAETSEPTEDAAAESAEPSELDLLKAQVARLEEILADQQAQLDRQGQSVEKQGQSLAKTKVAMEEARDFQVKLTGSYRTRGYVFGTKFGPNQPVRGGMFADQPTPGRFMDQRLRIGTSFKYKSLASVNVTLQALDDVIMGDNADVASAALFADNPSFTGRDGLEAPNIQVLRAWGEFRTPIGLVRFGRQPSHWGLGILANSGDGFDDDFGENRYHTSFDRILFGTNPASIVQAITGKGGKEIPITLAIAVDRLVEDPLTQYYGYECVAGALEGVDDNYDPRCDFNGDGLSDLDHGYTEARDASDRPQDWWHDQRDDVMEMVYALIYRGEDVRYFGGVGDLTAGAYVIHRTQKETDSDVVIADLYLDAEVHGVGLEFEGVGIWGRTRALNLPDSTADDPLQKKANIAGYVARVYYRQPMWKVLFESGLASGDDQVNDALFTGRSLAPDHNVGLLLYEEVIARVTQRLWGESARGLRSKGGVYNSHYIFPRVYAYPMDNTEIILGFLAAFPDKPDGAVIKNRRSVSEGMCGDDAPIGKSDFCDPAALGWEVDLAVKHHFHKHIHVSLEMGYAHATSRLPLDVVGLNPSGNFWTFQARAGWAF